MEPSDPEQLAAYWTVSQRAVGAFIATLVPDFHAAEDLLQAVAMALVRKFSEYDRSRPFTAWAIGIAKNEVLAHRRNFATNRIVYDDALVERITERYQQISAELEPMGEALRECLKMLEGRSRHVLNLRYGEGLKPAAVAERMRISSGAARTLLMRVRASVRKCIERRMKQSEAGV
jgi:RNA polymerase sigma-70 factor (ECF subfamily)